MKKFAEYDSPATATPQEHVNDGSKADLRKSDEDKGEVAVSTHLYDMHPGLTSEGEAAHATGGPGECFGVDPNGLKREGNHGGDENSERGGASRYDPGAVWPFDQFRK